MIDKIKLKNFQVHKNTELILSPGINVIIGETDQGKSSIARALYWSCFNRPAGNYFIKTGKQKCEVELTLGQNTVSRIKSISGLNQYVLNGKEFNALRSDIPEEIKEVLNLTETNIQLQHDPPFMLDMNASEVAKKLNSVIGINEIDTSLKYINSVIREKTAEQKRINTDIKKKKTELVKYDGLEEIQNLYAEYESTQERLTGCLQELKNITEILSALGTKAELEEVQEYVDAAKQVYTQIQELDNQCSEFLDDIDVLEDLIVVLDELEEDIQIGEKLIRKAEAVLGDYKGLLDQVKKIEIEYEDVKEVISVLVLKQSQTEEIEKLVRRSQADFDQYKEQLEICPLCDTNLGGK